jgi:hypothetical protein
MLNLFRWALTPQCPEIILKTVVICFLSALHSSNHGLRETLGKMECKNVPVLGTSQFFCHSSNILCFATGSKSRATYCALYTIWPKVACLASKSALSFPAIPTCAGIPTWNSVANIFVCTHTRTDGYVARFFCDSIALIELIYCRLRSSTFPVPHFL